MRRPDYRPILRRFLRGEDVREICRPCNVSRCKRHPGFTEREVENAIRRGMLATERRTATP